MPELIQQNKQLTQLNTMQIPARASFYAEVHTQLDLTAAVNYAKTHNLGILILGGGSNTLFTHDVNQLVVHLATSGITVIKQNDSFVYVKVEGGHNWHDLVTWSVSQNLGGIENLALIPGQVGAAPVQNIAAYGQNFSDTCQSLMFYDFNTQQEQQMMAAECMFGYRDSIFKHQLKGNGAITAVTLRLRKTPILETSYFEANKQRGSIKDELAAIATKPYTVQDVYQAVINIRSKKLPDIRTTPTVGSFFS